MKKLIIPILLFISFSAHSQDWRKYYEDHRRFLATKHDTIYLNLEQTDDSTNYKPVVIGSNGKAYKGYYYGGGGGTTTNALTIGAELSPTGATTFNGSAAKTIGIQAGSVTDAMLVTKPVKTLDVQYTDAANSGTSETDLMSYTVPAGQLTTDGDRIVIDAHFQTAANSNTKTLKFYFGGYNHTQSSSTIASGTDIHWRITIIRTSATTQRVVREYVTSFTTSPGIASAAETLSGTVALKFTGQSATASGDITQNTMTVTYYPAP